jgi:hypothetical protein
VYIILYNAKDNYKIIVFSKKNPKLSDFWLSIFVGHFFNNYYHNLDYYLFCKIFRHILKKSRSCLAPLENFEKLNRFNCTIVINLKLFI